MVTKKIGGLHSSLRGENKNTGDPDSAVRLFLDHGYYWTGALSAIPKLVTLRSFKFDSIDKQIASRYRLSMMNPCLPFDD